MRAHRTVCWIIAALCLLTGAATTAQAQEAAETLPSAAVSPDEGVAVGLFVNPGEGTIYIDGEPAGGGGRFIGHLGHGVHIIQFELEGHRTVQERLTLEPGDGPTYLVVHMRPSQSNEVLVGRRGGAIDGVDRDAFAWGLTVGGAAALVTGAVLLSYDGEPSCEGSSTECPEAYDTLTGGTILTTVGAAALTGGVILFLWDELAGYPVSAQTSEAPRTQLGVAPTLDGGGMMFLGGTF